MPDRHWSTSVTYLRHDIFFLSTIISLNPKIWPIKYKRIWSPQIKFYNKLISNTNRILDFANRLVTFEKLWEGTPSTSARVERSFPTVDLRYSITSINLSFFKSFDDSFLLRQKYMNNFPLFQYLDLLYFVACEKLCFESLSSKAPSKG